MGSATYVVFYTIRIAKEVLEQEKARMAIKERRQQGQVEAILETLFVGAKT